MSIFSPRWILVLRPVGGLTSPIMGWHPLLFDPQEPSYTCADREVLLDLRNGYLISVLWQNSALASNLVLGVSG